MIKIRSCQSILQKIDKFFFVNGGIIMIAILNIIHTYANYNLSCPPYYSGSYEKCYSGLYFAYFLIFQMFINLSMFLYSSRFNRLEYLIPISVVRQKSEEYRQLLGLTKHEMKKEIIEEQADLLNVPVAKYCHTCQILVPERCHHCSLCGYCVVKKDHHCYITGRCVGFGNQRYFLVFLFYGAVFMIYASLWEIRYLNLFYVPFPSFAFLECYMPPITLVKWLVFGTSSFEIYFFVMLNTMGFWSLISAGFFIVAECYLILNNITVYEYQKKIFRQKGEDTSTLSQRLQYVFGQYWLLNLIFPMPYSPIADEALQRFLQEFDSSIV